ncbi:MAG: HD domain-containing protein [Candidatus Kerfeldbacteria bacterium]
MKRSAELITAAKHHFLWSVQRGNPTYAYLPRHVGEVQKWTLRLLRVHRKANRTVALLAVWLHDIGWTVGKIKEDHAIASERETRRFLARVKVRPETVDRIAHCVRAHRCRDVQPETIEAKILAAADSASHMTDIVYIELLSKGLRKYVKEKLERDYRDVGMFPELQKSLTPLYRAWKTLVRVYPD